MPKCQQQAAQKNKKKKKEEKWEWKSKPSQTVVEEALNSKRNVTTAGQSEDMQA